jgi:single-strand DNA-binding protein
MNSVNLIGRLTADPEVRYLESGKAKSNFSIAINRGRDETDYFDIESWDKAAEVVSQYCKKGSQIGIEGRLRHERWQDRETQKPRSKVIVIANRIELLGSKDSAAGVPASGTTPRPESFVDTNYDSMPF